MANAIYERPIEILQKLIQFDTTNPPGNEAACVAYLDELLQAAGLTTTILAKDPQRPNLVARLAGRGEAPALVLQGHVDVVTTANQAWAQPPFAAKVVDNYLWGRGALDMKGGVVMMLCALLRAKAEGFTPAGDIILTIMSDEEAGSDYGARFLVEEHPEQFAGAKYAIGEGGGSSSYVGDQRFYSIMVAEKQVCWMRATFRGPGGHGSSPLRGGAMAKLGHVLSTLDQNRLPVHVTPVMEQMIATLAESAPAPLDALMAQLCDPAQSDRILDQLVAEGVTLARPLDALLHNTVNATVVQGGFKTNVIPSEIMLELDGRLLPGFTPADVQAELAQLLGEPLSIELIRHDPGRADVDMTLFPLFTGILHDLDPDAVPMPAMVGGFTDGRMFARLGIQNYGFLPLRLPKDFNPGPTVHAANERVPVDAIAFGCEAVYQVLRRYQAIG
ncbi:MAG: M20/M25/M40 family metallo-hydrolase [Caldilineaceae bacterium]|nr:M20/M25/M40 family metallo-hydrolase [Caldilineaceae bacterium]